MDTNVFKLLRNTRDEAHRASSREDVISEAEAIVADKLALAAKEQRSTEVH